MKLEKKHYTMIIAGAVILFVIYWLFFRKKETKSSSYLGVYGSDGTESSYKSCPEGEVDRICTKITDPNVNGGVTITKYKCGCKPAPAAGERVMNVEPKWTKKPKNARMTTTCFDDTGKQIPCKNNIPEEDVIRTTTFPA